MDDSEATGEDGSEASECISECISEDGLEASEGKIVDGSVESSDSEGDLPILDGSSDSEGDLPILDGSADSEGDSALGGALGGARAGVEGSVGKEERVLAERADGGSGGGRVIVSASLPASIAARTAASLDSRQPPAAPLAAST